MKRLLAILFSTTMLLSIVGCSNSNVPAATGSNPPSSAAPQAGSSYDKLDKIYIGSVTPLTGAGASSGEFNKKGMDLWAEQVNTAGGIMGKKVEIVYEDTQSTEAGSANAYQKLASRGDISAIHHGQFSNQVLATLPYVKQYKIPSITQGSSVKLTAAVAENPYTWQLRINDQGTAYSMVNAMVDQLGGKKIALIYDTDAFGQGLANNAIAALEAKGMKPEITLSFATGEKQFAGYLSQIKEKGCDSILLMAHPNETALIQIGINSQGMESLIKVGSPDAAGAVTIALSKDDANGWYTISDWVPSIEEEPGKTFEVDYEKKYNQVSDMACAVSYDILNVFKAAIEKAGSQDPEAIQKALGELDPLKGLISTFEFNDQHIGATYQYLCQTEDRIPKIMSSVPRDDVKK